MATIIGSSNSNNWTYKIEAYELPNSIDIANNTSILRTDIYIGRTSGAGQGPIGGNYSGHVSINWETSSRETQDFSGNISWPTYVPDGGWLYLQTKDFLVKHDDDGSKRIRVTSEMNSSAFTPSYCVADGWCTLSTIPRASSIAVGNYNLGQNISVTIGKKVNSFTSTLTYKIGSRTGTIATKTSNSTYVWEMPDELISQIKQDNPSNAKPSATIYCETYSGDTKIGSTQSASFTLVIVDKPTINDVVINETIELIKQYTNSIVKYLSVPQFNVTATPSEGSSIATYRVKVGDREITNYSDSLTINNIQYSYLVDNVRKTKFIVTVTDARGNTSEEYQIEMDFIDYVQLAFNNTDVTLTRLNGTSNFIKLHMTGYIYNGLIGETPNILTLQYRYKLKNDALAEWIDLKTIEATLKDDNTFIVDGFQLEDEFDYKENYDIEFYIHDMFLTTKYTTVIKTSETIVKVHKNGLDAKNLTINEKQVLYESKQEFYSTEEQIVGTWIDGTTIYKKTIETTCGELEGLLNDIGIHYLINVFGNAFSNYNHIFPINAPNEEFPNYKFSVYQTASSRYVSVAYNSPFFDELLKVICTVKYTKETDQKGMIL